jgi:hypothetical protein
MFITRPELHADNIARASQLRAAPGLLSKPDGSTEPAVVIFSNRGFQYALDEHHAYRLANAIADAIETNRK